MAPLTPPGYAYAKVISCLSECGYFVGCAARNGGVLLSRSWILKILEKLNTKDC